MGGDDTGLDRVAPGPRDWDRFARWKRGAAIALLAVVTLLAVLAALTPLSASMDGKVASVPDLVAGESGMEPKAPPRHEDFELYRAIEGRVAAGQDYYQAAVTEQRARNYPLRPGLTVRLPTLATAHALLGRNVMQGLSVLLLLATAAAWWIRLGAEPGGKRIRPYAVLLIFVASALVLNRDLQVLHEIWAGVLVALSLGLHRPGKWAASLAVAAIAIAVRELALPFVMLMGALAFWRRDLREGLAWSALFIAYLLGLLLHVSAISAQVGPADPMGPGWLAVDGYAGFLSKTVLSSQLRFLPHWIAAPLVVLAVLGWAGWRTDAGLRM